jgi:hypothetical protein
MESARPRKESLRLSFKNSIIVAQRATMMARV